MNLEIRITPIRFTSGKLVKERTIWMGNDNTPGIQALKIQEDCFTKNVLNSFFPATPNIRTKLEIPSPDVPTKQMKMSNILSNHNQYLLFDATSVYKDVSQTTIPYIGMVFSRKKVLSTGKGNKCRPKKTREVNLI